MTEERVPVLIVGGGMSGLTTALQLAQHDIRSIVIEKHPSTAHLPKAHTINQRSMEIFRQLGITEDFLRKATPPEHIQKAAWRTSFGGDAPYEGKVVVSVDAFGGGKLTEQYATVSPERYASYHQVILEPFLVDQLAEEPRVDLRFNTQIVDFHEETDGAITTIEDRVTGDRTRIRADYVVGADGGRYFQKKLGYEMEGVTALGDNVTLWFKADLSEYMDDDTLLNWFVTPDSFGMAAGVLVPVGIGKHSEEWVLHFGYPAGQGQHVTDAEAIARMLDLFNLPDLEFELIKVSRWSSEQVMADQFRIGRVICTGDAIHRHTPTLGIGMNSAIGDSHNLAWKLAYVLKGYASDSLLDTFDIERRPVLERNSELALQTYYLHAAVVPQIGMIPGGPEEYNKKILTRYFEDSPLGEDRRRRTHQLVESNQCLEHQALELELGYRYGGPAIAQPDTDYRPDPMLNDYKPVATPGARMPHLWLTAPDGSKISTLDLIETDFVLLVGSIHSQWIGAANKVIEELGVPIQTIVVGEGGYREESGRWNQDYQIGLDGAMLVRPDQHITWQTKSAHIDQVDTLRKVLSLALRPDTENIQAGYSGRSLVASEK